MVFSLEALHAMQGDSLLLHYGSKEEPRLIVIDGGPDTVYLNALRPRLEHLREAAGGALPIEILMVSHIDEDHIRGLIEFSQDLIREPQRQAGYPVGTLWHNAFEDVLAKVDGVKEAAASPTAPVEVELEVANVDEGRELRDNARTLHWPANDGFDGFVMAPEQGGAVPDLDLGPLKLTVVGPRQAELDKLRAIWEERVETLIAEDKLEEAAVRLDSSPSNLSSIVCVAEQDGKRMLLTGDARGDRVLKQLEAAGFMEEGGEMELDLLKVPHHGSDRNVKAGFFKRLPAKHLVISADGEHENPDVATLKMISREREDDDFTIYLTEPEFKEGMGPKIREFFAADKAKGRDYKVEFLPASEPALRIDL